MLCNVVLRLFAEYFGIFAIDFRVSQVFAKMTQLRDYNPV